MDPKRRKKILSGVITVGVLVSLYFVYDHVMYVNTDDAYVQAHTVLVSARVSAIVEKVLVDENQKVKAGDVLVQLDDRDYVDRLNQVQAEAAALQAQFNEAQTNFQRLSQLYNKEAVSKAQFDQAQAGFKNLDQKLKSASAQVEQAKLNLSYTKITAPNDGTVAKRSVELGAFVTMGTPLLGFVEAKERWVIANFKETDLADFKIGSKTFVTVDAIPRKTFGGEVESISPSTGATFALLPPDNSTGNFTKVVQRVPVKIKLTDLQPDDADRLQAGLSAVVTVSKH